MANIVIDPVIVMVPSDDATQAEVELWLESLTIWLKEALTAPFTWLHCWQASGLLEAHERFPSFARLRQLQRKYRLDPDITINEIARYVNDFFRDDMLDLEKHLNSLDYIIEPEVGSIIVKPEQFIARLPQYIHNDLYLLLANCCACKHIDHPFGQGLHVATLALEGGVREITVSVVILDALPDFIRPADNNIAQTFPLVITPDDLQPLADIFDLWAKGEHGIMYAIKQQYKKDQPDTDTSPFAFHLGPRFIESVNTRGLDTNETVLYSIVRAASDVIPDKAKDKHGYRLHPFRQSKTADSPQFVRDSDNAKAWRLMLQKHGAGWRLHYWQISTPEGSIIEFANVGKESEREIW
jgi:hypothetical protein